MQRRLAHVDGNIRRLTVVKRRVVVLNRLIDNTNNYMNSALIILL